MRQDFFEFAPQFKLLIAGNHKPGLRTVDEAMRRRFNLLPFTVTIPASERDTELTDKLRGEWGGILQWMVEGCLAWQREGLSAPDVVTQATEEYLASEDALGRWLEECCIQGRTYVESTSALYGSWQDWCRRNGEQPDSVKRFSQNLEARQFTRERSAAMRGFRGVAVRLDAAAPDSRTGSGLTARDFGF
jgi:putative DNA primase/helicase